MLAAMTTRDRMLALVVALLWGVNFTAIHLSLEQFPPFFLVALRFTLLAVPTILLVPRPDVPVRWLVGYGLGFGTLQFAFLYLAMSQGMPTGLSSLVLQSSAPFTVLLAGAFLRERISPRQALGVAAAVAGLAGIAALRAMEGGGAALVPVLLTLAGGLGWALGNLSSRLARPAQPLRLTLWMSVVPPVPMLVLSWFLDGPDAIARSVSGLTSPTGLAAIGGLAYTVVVATVLGSGIWTTLLARHPAGSVAPFSMLVPVAGIGAAWLVLGEPPVGAELGFGVLVLAGVLLGSLSPARRPAPSRSRRAPQPVP